MPSANNDTPILQFDTFTNTVNGKSVDTKATRCGINPATKKSNPPVPNATKQDLDDTVQAARTAFVKWSQSSVEERRAALLAFAEALKQQEENFAKLLTMEQGKPLAAARAEVKDGYNWMFEMANLSLPDVVAEDNKVRKVTIRYTPLGVAAAIVPWNSCGKIAPAIMTGNTVIIKPSPFTPYCGLKLAELASHFFPPGVVQALSGDDNLGPWITAHPGIDKISFTGSTATGKKVMESASKTLKRITLELGGKDPAIICKDVDVKEVAPKITAAAFANSGQICLALKRIYIHESIYKEFRDAMIAHTKTLVIGNGAEPGVALGPIQNSMQYRRVQGFFDDIEKDSLKVVVGGVNDLSSPGYFITPTIIDNPKETSRIVHEEPFGPIVPIFPWSNEDEVVAQANNTKMGLGASVWSSNLEEAQRIGARLEAGNVWINTHMVVDPNLPFSGHKESGIGSEWGITGLKSFCNVQTLMVMKA
ncbi:aldehyde dehydrogenase-1 [Coleophoma crateriformis]|uniref:aldehyde dehydrogenase (NAD(+)) n=1 Tax=Coleophoma crateriformis TaxID=565419 RepID=A0A3D8RJW6_9HELO|nr:aldehyde dehydrogenase-1 [Coleophoma crateriformis]